MCTEIVPIKNKTESVATAEEMLRRVPAVKSSSCVLK